MALLMFYFQDFVIARIPTYAKGQLEKKGSKDIYGLHYGKFFVSYV